MAKKSRDQISMGFITAVGGMAELARGARPASPTKPEPPESEDDAIAVEFLRLVEADLNKSSERVSRYTDEQAAEDDALLAEIQAHKS